MREIITNSYRGFVIVLWRPIQKRKWRGRVRGYPGIPKVLFTVEAMGKYRLPTPGTQVTDRIISIARSITHIDKDQGKVPVSLGLRNDRVELIFQFNRKEGGETFSILFPEL